jgi:hypothetical protein
MEALVVLTLMALVIPTGWTVLMRHRVAGQRVAGRAEGLETVRTLAWILAEETGAGTEGLDWRLEGGDALVLRAFRGHALLTHPSGGTGDLAVCFRGFRTPVPAKDSVLLLGADGQWRVHDLLDRRGSSTPCPGTEGEGREERWTLSPPPEVSVFGRLFETGRYFLTNGALRYRRGEGGRQPLTPERILTGRFLSPAEGGNPFGWEVVLRPEVPGDSASETSLWRGRGW